LCLHLRDLDLLKFIQNKLENKGKIYEYDTDKRKEAHLVISKISDLN
jgi:hypothetical protein